MRRYASFSWGWVQRAYRLNDFRRLWLASVISQFGTQVSFLAVPLAAIKILNASPLQLGILNALDFLPFAVVSLLAGVWIDRLRKRPILILADLARAILLLGIPTAYFLGDLSLWLLYSVVFSVGIGTVFFDSASPAYLPSIVGRDKLVDANAMLAMGGSSARVIGPSIAGLAVQWLTAPVAVFADSLSYIASAISLIRIQSREIPVAPSSETIRTSILSGLRFITHHTIIRPLVIYSFAANLAWSAVEAVFLIYASRNLGLSAGTIGVVFAVANIGLLVASPLAKRINKWVGTGPSIVAGAAIHGLGIALIPIAQLSLAAVFLALAGFVRSFGLILYHVNQESLRLAITPKEMRGRMYASSRFMTWSAIPLGSLLGGFAGNQIGLTPILWMGAAVSVISVFALILSPVRSMKSLVDSGVHRRDRTIRK